MQLSPNENYPIFHGIINHLDTDTYYVRTVIYDTGYNVLDTVDLEDKGNQNFLKMWKVPYDNVFQRGRFILLVTSTYTDSGYTTKSENYGDEFETHLIQERWDMSKISSVGGGGGYNGITTKDVKKVIKKELENIKFPKVKDVKFPKQKEYEANFKDITKGLTDIKALVGTLPAQNNDLRPIVSRLDELVDEVQMKPVTKETDIKPLLKSIKEAQQERSNNVKNSSNSLITLEKKILKDISEMIETTVNETIPNIIQNEMKNAQFSVPLSLGQPQMEEKKANISKLKSKFGIK